MSKTMEEVWKDISLSCFHDQLPSTTTDHDHHPNTTSLSGIILQDLFPQPYSKDSQPKQTSNRNQSPAPTTMLTLTSGTSDELSLFRNSSRQYLTQNLVFQPQVVSGTDGGGNVKEKKRCRSNISDSPDRLRKRMIKNRESAERSRARKQAYTDGLELEVDNLMKENHRLKAELKQLSLVAAAQLLKRPNLHRMSSAPF